jgi:dipeptidyl aminopeptidase/acylaminoacyl peptidase
MKTTASALLLACLVGLAGCVSEPEIETPLAELDSVIVRRAPGRYQLVTPLPNFGNIVYTLYVPNGLGTGSASVPLVVAAHFGGQVTPWLGGAFADLLVVPALTQLGAVVVAPDAGTASGWSAGDEANVMWLAREIARVYPIDPARIVMTGYSAGGAQTWLMSNRNQDFFKAAVPMSARPRQNEQPWRIPVFVIHSQQDELIPFETVQAYVTAQQSAGAPMRLSTVSGLTHYQTSSFVPHLRESVAWLSEVWPP